MRIAFIYDAMYPQVKGGVERRVYELTSRLASRGHDVHWFGLRWWETEHSDPVVRRDGVTRHGICPPEELYVDGRRSLTEPLRFAARLFPHLRRLEFDVVDCQAFPYFPFFPAYVYSSRVDSELVVTWHEVWNDYWFEYLGWKGIFGLAVERLMAKLSKRNLAVSSHTQRKVDTIGGAECTVVPNGVDTAAIASVKPASQDVDVLFAGRLLANKNLELVVKAVDSLRSEWPNINCYIIGDGPERDRIEKMVETRRLHSNVHFLGFLEQHEEVLRYMAAADVFLLPSAREGFGISVVEALATGTPVVTIDHPNNAASELITTGETGCVTAPDPESIANGIRTARAEATADACFRSAQNYDWDRITTQIESYYEQIKMRES